MQHTPEAGGASICNKNQARRNIGHPWWKRWKEVSCPLWRGCEHPQTTTCPTLNKYKWSAGIVMNENWLDRFCDHDSYSILMKESVALYHEPHQSLFKDVISRGEHFYGTSYWTLSLIQSNYTTWALTVFSDTETRTQARFIWKKNTVKVKWRESWRWITLWIGVSKWWM